MNEMKMPGFTAKASLYKTRKPYGMAATFEAIELSTTVYPQRATGPYGPIGLPGQSCYGACEHVCRMGIFFDLCMADCLSKCKESSFNAWL